MFSNGHNKTMAWSYDSSEQKQELEEYNVSQLDSDITSCGALN